MKNKTLIDTGYLSFIIATRKYLYTQTISRWFPASWVLESRSARYDEYPAYKYARLEKRAKNPEKLRVYEQAEEIRGLIAKEESLTRVVSEGGEADDTIAALAYLSTPDLVIGVDKDYSILELTLHLQFADYSGNSTSPLERFVKKLPLWMSRVLKSALTRENLWITHALIGDDSDSIPRIIYRGDSAVYERIMHEKETERKIELATKVYGEAVLLNLGLVSVPYYRLLGYSSPVEMILGTEHGIRVRVADNMKLDTLESHFEDW